MVNISLYKLELVKERSGRYDIKKKISSPLDAYKAFEDIFHLSRQTEEVLAILCLNTKNVIIGAFEVSRGGLNFSVANSREIFKRAILLNSASIILAHNHPSGDPSPSNQDISSTINIKKSGSMLGIELMDHIIIGDGNYNSIREYTDDWLHLEK